VYYYRGRREERAPAIMRVHPAKLSSPAQPITIVPFLRFVLSASRTDFGNPVEVV